MGTLLEIRGMVVSNTHNKETPKVKNKQQKQQQVKQKKIKQ